MSAQQKALWFIAFIVLLSEINGYQDVSFSVAIAGKIRTK